ncbi:uncharacterized protein LOC144921380 [Branchiostoma floridae x Branchiostoma belcheri]
MAARGSRYGRRLLSSFLTVGLQTETGGANSRTAQGQAQGVLRRVHGWHEGIREVVSRPRSWLQLRNSHVPAGSQRMPYSGTAGPYPGTATLFPGTTSLYAGTEGLYPSRAGPTARHHILTSHTFRKDLFPTRGGDSGCVSCIHCSTFHSSAHITQRSEEKPGTAGQDQGAAEEEEEEDLVARYRDLTLFQRFKYMVKDYGHVLIPVHVATSLVWFGCFYYMAISGVDPVPLLEKIGLPHSWVETMKKSGASDVMVAYAFYKIATPARYTVTLGGTTFTIRYLRKKGVMQKPPPSKHMEKMKDFIQEKRDQLKNK